MVVMYAIAWWKWNLFARYVITTPYIALVNILAGRELVPEYIPFHGSPLPVAGSASNSSLDRNFGRPCPANSPSW